MAHAGDGEAPPRGCWNTDGRRVDGGHAYHSAALRAGQAGVCHNGRSHTAVDHEDARAFCALPLQFSPGADQFAPSALNRLLRYSPSLS
jgi:hypothetical protein